MRSSPLGWMSVALLFASHAFAASVTPEQVTALDRLSASGTGAWRANWDPKLGTPQSLFGRGVPPLPGWRADPAKAVGGFFDSHREMFRLRPDADELRLSANREQQGIHHLRFGQFYKDIPVADAEYSVAVDDRGSLHLITGRMVPDIAVDVTPTIDRSVAGTVALKASASGSRLADEPARLVVTRIGDADHLAWEMETVAPSLERWRLRVDAHDGSLLSNRSSSPHDQCWEDGAHGYVWPKDGTSSATDVLLPNLATFGALSGSFAHAHNAEGTTDATNDDQCGDFYYPSSDAHFTEVNTYYHMNKYLSEFMPSIGYGGLGYVLGAVVNRPYPAVFYQGHVIYLWQGNQSFYQSAGRAADIIAHESQHAVTESFGIGYDENETVAINEGLSDYFACAYTNDPKFGEWFYVTCPDGGTWMDSDPAVFKYSNFIQNYDDTAHILALLTCAGNIDRSNGMIYNGALWRIRSHNDPATIDQLVLESLAYVPSEPNFGSMYDAMLQADLDHHDGQFAASIDSAFNEREIVPTPTVGIHGPGVLGYQVSQVYTAEDGSHNVIPFASYRWYKRTLPSGHWTPIGTASSVTVSETADFRLQVFAVDNFDRQYTVYSDIDIVPTVSLSGPSSIEAGDPATFTATAAGAGITYGWQRRDAVNPGQYGAWYNISGTGSSNTVTSYDSDFQIKVTVTASDGSTAFASAGCAVTGGGGFMLSPVAQDFGASAVVHGKAAIELSSPVAARVTVHDVTGRLVRTLWSGAALSRSQRIEWDTSALSSGVYFYRASIPGRSLTRRFVVVH